MTVRELSKLYYIDKLIERDKAQLIDMRSQLMPGGLKLTGMPRARGSKNLIEELVPLIDELERKLTEEVKQYLEERLVLQNYIRSVPDPQIQLIMTMRFIDLMSWQAIAMKIGGGNTADAVRKACYRFVKKAR